MASPHHLAIMALYWRFASLLGDSIMRVDKALVAKLLLDDLTTTDQQYTNLVKILEGTPTSKELLSLCYAILKDASKNRDGNVPAVPLSLIIGVLAGVINEEEDPTGYVTEKIIEMHTAVKAHFVKLREEA